MNVDPRLSEWESFYVIVGSSGGALVGIQFVVIALLADVRRRAPADAINAFATPTVVHFGMVLAVAAILSAPWPSLLAPSVALALCGLGGLAYGAVVIRRALRQTEYEPERDDWVWYSILPTVAHAALGVGAYMLRAATGPASLVIGGAALGLLLVGIRNAWDTVTHIVITRPNGDGVSPD